MSDSTMQKVITPETVKAAHENAKAKGFWRSDNLPEKLALVHSEVSEALEQLRHMRVNDKAFGCELADIVIRTMDIAGVCGIDLVEAVLKKMAFNESRPHMHGKRF